MAKLLRHGFTDTILELLEHHLGDDAERVFEASPLLQYINTKTRSATSGSKSRGSFANHYALYIVIEDYIAKGYSEPASSKSYSEYEGARYTDLLNRQRELPFGSKLQNHGLNSRLNDEFRKYFPSLAIQPIIRDLETQRYWIHEDLLRVTTRDKAGHDVTFNLAHVIIKIIDAYVASKRAAFESFIQACKDIVDLTDSDQSTAVQFIKSQLQPTVDARVFEIVSYAILKTKYGQETIWIGGERDDVAEEILVLYKTGRTNANDGGIDFVMKPLGRFFQVTETIDAGKYFLDIDKVQRFPMTFVVKSDLDVRKIFALVEAQARLRYKAESIVAAYMNCIEEIINTPILLQQFQTIVDNGKTSEVINEVILQSKLEFNFTSDMDGAVD